MRKILVFVFVFINGVVSGQVVGMDSVRMHKGTLTTVCDSVWDVYVSKSKTIYINFGGKYPKVKFRAVIFAKDTIAFKDYRPEEFLKHKNICVTGMIKIYKGQPEVIIKGPNQIRVRDDE